MSLYCDDDLPLIPSHWSADVCGVCGGWRWNCDEGCDEVRAAAHAAGRSITTHLDIEHARRNLRTT